MNKYQEALDNLAIYAKASDDIDLDKVGWLSEQKEIVQELIDEADWLSEGKKAVQELIDEADILDKAFDLYIDWSTQCHFGYDNIPDEFEAYEKEINDKELGYNEGLKYIAIEEARKL